MHIHDGALHFEQSVTGILVLLRLLVNASRQEVLNVNISAVRDDGHGSDGMSRGIRMNLKWTGRSPGKYLELIACTITGDLDKDEPRSLGIRAIHYQL